jgi:hypothetical protein
MVRGLAYLSQAKDQISRATDGHFPTPLLSRPLGPGSGRGVLRSLLLGALGRVGLPVSAQSLDGRVGGGGDHRYVLRIGDQPVEAFARQDEPDGHGDRQEHGQIGTVPRGDQRVDRTPRQLGRVIEVAPCRGHDVPCGKAQSLRDWQQLGRFGVVHVCGPGLPQVGVASAEQRPGGAG